MRFGCQNLSATFCQGCCQSFVKEEVYLSLENVWAIVRRLSPNNIMKNSDFVKERMQPRSFQWLYWQILIEYVVIFAPVNQIAKQF